MGVGFPARVCASELLVPRCSSCPDGRRSCWRERGMNFLLLSTSLVGFTWNCVGELVLRSDSALERICYAILQLDLCSSGRGTLGFFLAQRGPLGDESLAVKVAGSGSAEELIMQSRNSPFKRCFCRWWPSCRNDERIVGRLPLRSKSPRSSSSRTEAAKDFLLYSVHFVFGNEFTFFLRSLSLFYWPSIAERRYSEAGSKDLCLFKGTSI